MRKFKVTVGVSGGRRDTIIEVDDDASEVEIQEEAWVAATEYIDFSYKETKEEPCTK